MDGRDFLKALRSHKMLCHVPVVVISGVEDAEVIHATDNVRKSALLEGLRRVLERLQLREVRALGEAAPPESMRALA